MYSLKPIGIEEPYIESLTSYLIRLSEAHQVYPSSLISYIIAPILNKEFLIYSTARGGNRFYDGAKTMNGFGSNALDMVDALEKLTKVEQLGILTLVSIKEVVPLRYLLKNHLSWCAVCYEEQLNTGDAIYNLLLWSLEMVNTCSRHRCKLEAECFLCHKKIPVLHRKSQNGYCPYCSTWLGAEANFNRRLDENDFDYKITLLAEQIIKHKEQIKISASKHQVIRNLNHLVDIYTEGNMQEFAWKLNLAKTTLWDWCNGKALPPLSRVLEICYLFDMSPVSFYIEDISINKEQIAFNAGIYSKDTKKREIKFDYDTALSILQKYAHHSDSNVSMNELAKQLGYSKRTLYKYFPNLCKVISTKNADAIKEKTNQVYVSNCLVIYQHVENLMQQGVYPSRRRIEEMTNKPGLLKDKKLRDYFKELIEDKTCSG
ncbi:TniQ family protein [Bacillus pseudomycoides]|uniref:TniQ family protein n=1 Tax=Bacillus TaxID=1386 RepID=UPI002248EF73|nr:MULTISPECIES: TniQ family protein [Bacillus]MCX2828280.1 TniQ family protein [Bacillus sp. DHT2]MDR4917356.1 TniQ family protein [Bacillus pseudomycoides]